ncbi:MAG: Maf-like protein [Prevotellaceae bacterium]|nr:Maf-like protein [Prevotellaceae bacterium]
MLDNLKKYNIVLASNSPRRRELLAGLGIDFIVKVIADIDESYPDSINASEVAQYIAEKKAKAYQAMLHDDSLVITADTVVIVDNHILGKPKDESEATAMLSAISGRSHHVVTGVCIMTKESRRCFSVTTEVTFATLSPEEIDYYVCKYRPFDKAGAYGIQEWIGYIGVTSLSGSYFNVMGLPVQRIYSELKKF